MNIISSLLKGGGLLEVQTVHNIGWEGVYRGGGGGGGGGGELIEGGTTEEY